MANKRRLAETNMASCRKIKRTKTNADIVTHAVRYLTTDAWAHSIHVYPPDPMIAQINVGLLPWDTRVTRWTGTDDNTTWETLSQFFVNEYKKIWEMWDPNTQDRYSYVQNLKRIGFTYEPYSEKDAKEPLTGYVNNPICVNFVHQVPDCLVKTKCYVTKIDIGNGWENLVTVDSHYSARNTIRVHERIYATENPEIFRLFVLEEYERWYSFASMR